MTRFGFQERTSKLALAALAAGLVAAPARAGVCVWAPPGVKVLRGLLYMQADNDQASDVCPDMDNSRWAEMLKAWRFGMAITNQDGFRTLNDFKAAMATTGAKIGHPELPNLPVVSDGFSHLNDLNQTILKAWPQQLIASAILHITQDPQPKPTDTAMLKSPMYVQTGPQDFMWDGLFSGFEYRNIGAQWFPAPQLGGHDYTDAELLLNPFFEQCIRLRLPADWDPLSGPPKLRNLPEEAGWLGFGDEAFWGSNLTHIVPAATYTGHKNNAFYLPGGYFAYAYRAYLSNKSPVSMTSPTMQDNRFAANFDPNLPIAVTATTTAANLDTLTLYDGDIPLKAFAAGAAYTVSPTDFAPGVHAVHALAKLKDGSQVDSKDAVFCIRDSKGITAQINSPNAWDVIVKGAPVQVAASVSCLSSAASQVEFFADGVSIGKASAAPFQVQWTPPTEGDVTLKAVAKDAAGDSIHAWPVKVRVLPQAPVAASVQLQPQVALIRPGTAQAFTAVVRDQYGRALNPQPAVNWSVSGGGTVAAGTVTAQAAIGGPFTVTASAAGVSAQATFQVTNILRIKFGPTGIALPDGFRQDDGSKYGDRGNGLTYGWDNSPRYGRSRWVPDTVPLEYQSFLPMRWVKNPPYDKGWDLANWSIAVPAGAYTVHIGAGDPMNLFDIGQGVSSDQYGTVQHAYKFLVNGMVAMDSVMPPLNHSWVDASAKADAKDGKLTLSPAWTDKPTGLDYFVKVRMDKVDFIDIIPDGETLAGIPAVGLAKAARPSAPLLQALPGRLLVDFGAGEGDVTVRDLSGRLLWRAHVRGRASLAAPEAGAGLRLVTAAAAGRSLTRSLCLLK